MEHPLGWKFNFVQMKSLGSCMAPPQEIQDCSNKVPGVKNGLRG